MFLDIASAACCLLLFPVPVTRPLLAGEGSPAISLMQAGLAYVSVHTSQSDKGPELRGQLVPYGKVMGNSAALAK
jgi:hypothetical protein